MLVWKGRREAFLTASSLFDGFLRHCFYNPLRRRQLLKFKSPEDPEPHTLSFATTSNPETFNLKSLDSDFLWNYHIFVTLEPLGLVKAHDFVDIGLRGLQ